MPLNDNDDQLISGILNDDPTSSGKLDFLNRPLEPGEKADDAIDYEDIDDDDLADDDEDRLTGATNGDTAWQNGGQGRALGELDELTQEGLSGQEDSSQAVGDELDDLFGEAPTFAQGPHATTNGDPPATVIPTDLLLDVDDDEHVVDASASGAVVQHPSNTASTVAAAAAYENGIYSAEETARLMAQNFAMVPAPPENREEALAVMWPKFDKDQTPQFMKLLPPKKSQYVAKAPWKPPKPTHPNKVGIDLAPDQERLFRNTTLPLAKKRDPDSEVDARGLVPIHEDEPMKDASETDADGDASMDEAEMIGGVTWEDLKMVCQDWETPLAEEASLPEPVAAVDALSLASDDLFGEQDEDWARGPEGSSAKRRRLDPPVGRVFATPSYEIPFIDDPERLTSRIARRVVLDLNDPQLLVEVRSAGETGLGARLANGQRKSDAHGNLTKELSRRYNVSNDQAYDLLKENHQSKVRSTLGNLAVEHSMPALRLQYPYYKVKLHTREARSFHRPAMNFVPNVPVRFAKMRHVKRKNVKGKETREIFAATKDLSLGDNSHVLLLEYSEEQPLMMSNFGMGSRLINYYRRKDMEDHARPKLDIGETAVLLPQDKSPFSIFGNIEPGQTLPALYNGMFRAPVFKQAAKGTDFLVIRNTTGVEGSLWYLRTIEHLYVVGQEFPSVDVPGPHSRKVTTAAKNRLKMISYRKMRRNQPNRISVSEVTEHFPDTTDMQNRQKMKEFMVYSKDHKEWEMRPGETIPDAASIRTMVKPEDVCLLEASQVGLRHLQDAGYGRDDEDSDDEEGKEGQSLEQQLAPWHTTRNFLHATQGKAMLQLHGEGDPSGRGEAFSFIRTSMKGGFRPEGESAADKMDAKKSKEMGGHSYNVARQQKAYQAAIRRIWDAQKTSLSSTVDPAEVEGEDEMAEAAPDLLDDGRTPRSSVPTPVAPSQHADDETGSLFSRYSLDSHRGRIMRIARKAKKGAKVEAHDVISDPRVIREYLKRRHALEAEALALSELKPTGDLEFDRRAQKRLEEELARLERNKDRRIARDKQKGIWPTDEAAAGEPGSPNSPAVAASKGAGTARRCANCKEVGHIKTNKKLCPLLNGTRRPEDVVADAGFGSMGTPAPL